MGIFARRLTACLIQDRGERPSSFAQGGFETGLCCAGVNCMMDQARLEAEAFTNCGLASSAQH